MCSLHSFRIKLRVGSTTTSKRSIILLPDPSNLPFITFSDHDFAIGRHPRYTGSKYTIPHRLTVAGEATARSFTSNIIVIVEGNLIRSPLLRQSVLLSSSTVFIDSIQIASTGPSQQIHFFALSPAATALQASRTMVEIIPSVHSFVNKFTSPYSSPMVIDFGLSVNLSTFSNPPSALSSFIWVKVCPRIVETVVFPTAVTPTSITPWRTTIVSCS